MLEKLSKNDLVEVKNYMNVPTRDEDKTLIEVYQAEVVEVGYENAKDEAFIIEDKLPEKPIVLSVKKVIFEEANTIEEGDLKVVSPVEQMKKNNEEKFDITKL